MSNVGYHNNYGQQEQNKRQRQEWLQKMKSDRQAGTGAYTLQQGGPNVAQYPNVYQNPSQNRFTRSNPAQADPYQLPPQPTFSNQAMGQPPMMYPGQQQISTVGNMGPNIGMQPRPRPQQPTLAQGQQPYGGPAIVPMQRPPQSAFGQQNPTIFNQNFAQSPAGQAQMPYQPRRTQFNQRPQGSQWGY